MRDAQRWPCERSAAPWYPRQHCREYARCNRDSAVYDAKNLSGNISEDYKVFGA
jgi:hypothetical protein